ncbi:MAG: nitroreductase, partial [Chloroflexi bacterium]|nr:nitroreductase [Chloroflexota bacterium]
MPIRGIGSQFIVDTQYQNMDQSDQQKGVPQPPLELPYDTTQPLMDLPDPTTLALPPVDLREIIEQRTTIRNYAQTPLSVLELSHLLWCTQGVKSAANNMATRRTVPSAGARHAFETFLLINNVEGIDPGIYRFLAGEHKLLALELGERQDAIRRVTRA